MTSAVIRSSFSGSRGVELTLSNLKHGQLVMEIPLITNLIQRRAARSLQYSQIYKSLILNIIIIPFR